MYIDMFSLLITFVVLLHAQERTYILFDMLYIWFVCLI